MKERGKNREVVSGSQRREYGRGRNNLEGMGDVTAGKRDFTKEDGWKGKNRNTRKGLNRERKMFGGG